MLPIFPFYDPSTGMNDEMFEKPLFKKHAGYVMKAITTVVDGLDDIAAVVKILTELGDGHFKRGIKAEHYAPIGEGLIVALEMHLGDDWNDDVKNAWATAFSVIEATM